jgi:hypothetical protein
MAWHLVSPFEQKQKQPACLRHASLAAICPLSGEIAHYLVLKPRPIFVVRDNDETGSRKI